MKQMCAGQVEVVAVDETAGRELFELRHSAGKLTVAYDGKRFHVSSRLGVWACAPDDTVETFHNHHYPPIPSDGATLPSVYDSDKPDASCCQDAAAKAIRALCAWYARDPARCAAVMLKCHRPAWGCRQVARYVGLNKSQTSQALADVARTMPQVARLLGVKVSRISGKRRAGKRNTNGKKDQQSHGTNARAPRNGSCGETRVSDKNSPIQANS